MERAVDRETTFAVPPDQVWPAVTDPERLGEWMGGEVELELRPGGRGRFDLGGGDVRHAIVQAVEPEHLLAFSWWPAPAGPASTVTFTLDPDGAGGTVLRIQEVRATSLRAAA